MFKIQAAQRMEASEIRAYSAEEAGKLYTALRSALGKPTDKSESKFDTRWNRHTTVQVHQKVTWEFSKFTLELTLKKNDTLTILFNTKKDNSWFESSESTAKDALAALQNGLKSYPPEVQAYPQIKKIRSLHV